ncbi:hypothetical protein J6590_094459 [Homalodisca vitripennis]|nr:hypothetical protein J6590_055351 [Homalodisca vitripennis]KAG8309083.1 hypothetical protein J6590_094459 [Homalodisca vitripennis]
MTKCYHCLIRCTNVGVKSATASEFRRCTKRKKVRRGSTCERVTDRTGGGDVSSISPPTLPSQSHIRLTVSQSRDLYGKSAVARARYDITLVLLTWPNWI